MHKVLKTANASDIIAILDELKVIAEFKSDKNDDQLRMMLPIAQKFLEKRINMPILDAVWDLYYDRNEISKKFNLQGMNVSSIDSYNVIDDNGTETAVTSSYYRLSNGYIIFDTQSPYGSVSPRYYDAVRIEVTAGYGATPADLPDDLKKALAFLLRHWYQYGLPEDDKYQVGATPVLFDQLIMDYENIRGWLQ
jgi:uncharacterized phiE125 gp8 family phage protein